MGKKKIIYLVLVLFLFLCCGPREEKVERIIVDGELHIKNPELPLKGTIELDIEKIREIDPYQYEEVGLSSISSARDETGEVILYDSGNCEAHRFSPGGEYLGNFITQGQGPGEFQEYHGMRPCYLKDRILVTSSIKMAWFTREGEFISERKLTRSPDSLIDENRYISHKTEWKKTGSMRKIFLVELTGNRKGREGPIFFEGENIGLFYDREKSRGFSDIWVTPNFYHVYNPFTNRIIGCLNKEYKVFIKDLSGKTEAVIEKPYRPVYLSNEQKKELCNWKPDNEFTHWKLSVYPDTLLAIKGIKVLPKGNLAVYRFSGFKEYEIDIYDLEGKYLNAVRIPEDIPLDRARFYDFGFSTVETREDMLMYVEYRIKNLPEIFKSDY